MPTNATARQNGTKSTPKARKSTPKARQKRAKSYKASPRSCVCHQFQLPADRVAEQADGTPQRRLDSCNRSDLHKRTVGEGNVTTLSMTNDVEPIDVEPNSSVGWITSTRSQFKACRPLVPIKLVDRRPLGLFLVSLLFPLFAA